jgi:DNA-binding CsgD family transcriptional regulator
MSRLSAVDRLIGQTYDCLAEEDGWRELLTSYARFIGGDSGLIYLKPRGGPNGKILTSLELDASYSVGTYFSYYERRSPFFSFYKRLPEGQVHALGAYAFSMPYRETEYFQDWVRPQGWGDLVGVHLLRNHQHSAWLSIRRAEERGKYSASEVRAASRLVPHLGRAMSLRFKLGAERAASNSLRNSLEFVGFGVIIVDANSKILIANGAADAVLKVGDGLKSRQGRLSCERPRDAAALRAAVAAAAQARSADCDVAMDFCVIRNKAYRPLTVHVVPLSSASATTGFIGQSAVAIFVIDPLRGEPDSDGFARAWALTPAERRVLQEVVRGSGVVEAAATLGVAVPTARTHLQHVFQKTNTASQAELVRLVMLSPLRHPSQDR